MSTVMHGALASDSKVQPDVSTVTPRSKRSQGGKRLESIVEAMTVRNAAIPSDNTKLLRGMRTFEVHHSPKDLGGLGGAIMNRLALQGAADADRALPILVSEKSSPTGPALVLTPIYCDRRTRLRPSLEVGHCGSRRWLAGTEAERQVRQR